MVTDKDQDSDSQNQDNTDSSNGKGSESDIMAIKRAHEVELRERDDRSSKLTQEVATERAARDAAEVRLKESSGQLETTQQELADLRIVQDANSKSIEELRQARLSDRKSFLTQAHGLKEDQIKDMDESQLSALETILPTVKTVPTPANLDLGPGGGGDTSDMSARDLIRAGMDSS